MTVMSEAKSKTVLVVDDSATVRSALKRILHKTGMEVAEAANGKQGLEVLDRLARKGHVPVLIISDLNMPVMDGLSFIRRVKKTHLRFVPILVLSSENPEKFRQVCIKTGAAGWLSKPPQPEMVIKTVRKFTRSL